MKENTLLGTITLTDKTDVTDPCYDQDVWCRMNNVKTVPGRYDCYVERLEGDDTVAACIVVHEGNSVPKDNRWRLLGTIGVDAGMAGFFVNKPDFADGEWKEYVDKVIAADKKLDKGDPDRDGYIIPTKNGDAFFTTSGWGDGAYDVYGVGNGTAYYALKIVFLTEEDYD